MNVQITSKNWILPEAERDVVERRIGRLDKKLPHMHADLLHLIVRIDKHPTREEYTCSSRLTIVNRVIAARSGPNGMARTSITEAFDDIERRLDKVMAGLHARV